MPRNTSPCPPPGCGTCCEVPKSEPRLRFIWPLAAAIGAFAAIGAGVSYEALEPACETSYRAQLGSGTFTAEGLIEYCRDFGDEPDDLSARR